jgi:hypothetical protein
VKGLAYLSPWIFLGSVATETVGAVWFARLSPSYSNFVFAFMAVVQLLPFIVGMVGYWWLGVAHRRAELALLRARVRWCLFQRSPHPPPPTPLPSGAMRLGFFSLGMHKTRPAVWCDCVRRSWRPWRTARLGPLPS